MVNSLHSTAWDGIPQKLGDLFRVHNSRCGRQVEAVCGAWSHQLGWELRLEIGGPVQRSKICRSHDDVLAAGDQWQAALVEKGWQ